jgi:hypothetical protein
MERAVAVRASAIEQGGGDRAREQRQQHDGQGVLHRSNYTLQLDERTERDLKT